MPSKANTGLVCLLMAVLPGTGCQVQDQGLQSPVTPPTAAPTPAPAPAPEVTHPPSIDPPATPPPPPATPLPPPAAVPVPTPVPPIDNPAAPDAGPAAEPSPCASPRTGPFTLRVRNPNIESDEVVFDPDGQMLLVRDSDVVMLETGSAADPILRSVLGRGGGALRFMADGTLLVADFTGDSTSRYDLPSRRVLFRASTRSPMKMAVGPGERLYVSSQDGFIYLVNTRTGGREVLASPSSGVGGLAFSTDYRTLYAGMLQDQTIAAFPVESDGGLGPPRTLSRGIPFPFALAVDECGNLYTSGGTDGEVRRISPAGRAEVIVRTDMPELWGMAFGSGKHGWSDTALYITSDSNGRRGLFEVQVGVKGAPPAPVL